MSVRVSGAILEEMRRHAEEAYPEECCGIVTADPRGALELRRCRNIQNDLHADDPTEHPRDARTAYYIDPQELLAVVREVDGSGGELSVLYHSHPDHDAYFSAEDRARAVMDGWDEPAYPGLSYVVLSVRDRRAAGEKAFVWDPATGEFTERALEAVE